MKSLVKYLEENLALNLEIKAAGKQLANKLPLFLKGNYSIFEGDLYGLKVYFAEVALESKITPDRLEKQGHQLQNILNGPVIFIIHELPSWDRKRLVSRNISFVQPGRQIYMPDFLIELNDAKMSYQSFPPVSKKLTYPAQLALLYHIQVEKLENVPLNEIAVILNYSPMTISRIVKELEQHQIIRVEGNREKMMMFLIRGRKELWEKIKDQLRSPVREVISVDHVPAGSFESYDNALAHYTDLSPGRQRVYAIGKEDFKEKHQEIVKQPAEGPGIFLLEIWQYSPRILSKHKDVDRLSLYLSMLKEDDERIKIALEQLIEENIWS